MKKFVAGILLLTGLVAGPLLAQDFNGTFELQSESGTNLLSLHQDGQGKVTGTLSMSGGDNYELNGQLQDMMVVGIWKSKALTGYFEAEVSGDDLVFYVVPPGSDGKPDMDRAQEFDFTRKGGTATGGAEPPPAPRARGATGSNPLGGARSHDPFSGTFSNSELQLQLTGNGGRYKGEIHFQGKTFPVSASSNDGHSLAGNFSAGQENFDFTAQLEDGGLRFETGGKTYQLQGHGASASSNPLDGGGHSADGGGIQRTSAAVVNDAAWGIHFDPPPGWKYRKGEGVYIMGHDTIPGMILIMPHPYKNLQEARAAAAEPLYQAEDGQLMVTGEVRQISDGLMAADYGGIIQGKQARGHVVCVLSPYGGGVLILAGNDAASYSQRYATMAEDLARGMTFTKPAATPEVQQWNARLRGHRLAYLTSGGDTNAVDGSAYSWSDRKNVYLCSNGTFQAEGGFSGSIGTPGSTGIATNGTGPLAGQWKVTTIAGMPVLEFDLQNGETATFKLSAQGSKTFLDGKRWMVVENNVCP
jgi:hypothetical protein